MSKPSRDQLMADSHQAIKEAIRVLGLKNAATYTMLEEAHSELNRTGDGLKDEPGISIHLSILKKYKAALKLVMQTRERLVRRG